MAAQPIELGDLSGKWQTTKARARETQSPELRVLQGGRTEPKTIETPPVGDDLFHTYQHLVRWIARRLARTLPAGVSMDDLLAAGAIGLVTAASSFDPTRGVPFRAYASFRIRGAMLDELRAQDWVPRARRDRSERILRAEHAAAQRHGRTASSEDVAHELGMPLDEFLALRDATPRISIVGFDDLGPRRLDHLDAGAGLWSRDRTFDVDDVLDAAKARAQLREAVRALPTRLARVAWSYYFEGSSLKAIGKELGVTESRVCQLRSQAVRELRARLEDLDSPGLSTFFAAA